MDNDVLLTEHLWGSDQPRQPHLRFGADGRISGSDGCNRLMGQWTIDESDPALVHLGQMASTMMFCEGVDEWLKRGVAVLLQPDELVVLDARGEEIGRLPAAATNAGDSVGSGESEEQPPPQPR